MNCEEPNKYPLNTLYFYLSKGCNLCCRHCWIAPEFQSGDRTFPYLSAGVFEEITGQAMHLGLSGVKLTGGEPLLNPEIREILEIIRSKGLSCTVETNGLLCAPEIADLIASCKEPFVSVSLDGADADTHEWVRGVAGCFDSAIEGIRNLVAAGVNPQIIMTVMRHNKEQLRAMVRLAEYLGAESVKFNILNPTARGEDMHRAGEALTVPELISLGGWVENELSAATDMRLFFDHPMAFRPLGRMFGEKGDGCGTCGILGILGVLPDGSYALCGIGESLPELIFGKAATDSLMSIWNNHPLLLKIREGLPGKLKGVCGMCLMKNVCIGSCLAQNYYSSGDLFAPYYYCDRAYKEGLFPKTRLIPEVSTE